MIPDENKLGAYVRYLRDHGLTDAIGAYREEDGIKQLGLRIGGSFYSVAELRDPRNRTAVLARNFAQVHANRARDRVRQANQQSRGHA